MTDIEKIREKIAKVIWCEGQGDTGWETSHSFYHKDGVCFALAAQILSIELPERGCSRCKGFKQVLVKWGTQASWECCPTCNGTGKLKGKTVEQAIIERCEK